MRPQIDSVRLAFDEETDKANHWSEDSTHDLPWPVIGTAAKSDTVGEHRCQQDQYADSDKDVSQGFYMHFYYLSKRGIFDSISWRASKT
jgi:hypothetical protein